MSYVQLLQLTQPVATALAGLSGAIAGIAAAIITALLLHKNEKRRIKEDREKAISEDLSEASQNLTIKMAASLHSMCWLTWLARYGPNRVDQDRIDLYDEEQHKILPEIFGYLSTVAIIDADIYEKLKPLAYKIFALDAYIGEACLLLESDPDRMIRELANAYEAMVTLEVQLPKIISNVVGHRMRAELPAVVDQLGRPQPGSIR